MRSHRNSRLRLAISWLVSVAMLGGAAGCSSDSTPILDTPPDASLPSATAATTTIPISPANAEPRELGSTEVGMVINLPLLDVDWTWIPLKIEDPDAIDAWPQHVVVSGDQFVVVAFAWKPPPENQSVYTWTSLDGVEWAYSEMAVPQGESMHTVVSTSGGLVGLGHETFLGSTYPKLWRLGEAAAWETLELAVSGLDLHDVNLIGAAANEGGLLVGASLDIYRTDEPLTFESNGFRFTLDDFEGRFDITEIETGRVVAAGRWADIYQWSDEGQAIYDTDTAALITIVPWEVWDGIYRSFSPLPIPIAAPEDFPTAQTVEWDGYKVTVDEANDSFDVARDGEIITAGRLQDLYRGPSPSFSYAGTDEPAVAFTWDEWDQLVDDAYAGYYDDESHTSHESQQLVLFSADGMTWSREILDDDENTHLESVAAVGNAFIVNLVEHGGYESSRVVFTSVDGIDWERVEVTGPDYAGVPHSGTNGLIAISWGENRPAVTTSDDGINWTESLILGLQDDARDGWLRMVAAGEMGRAAVGTLSQAPPYENLQITVGELTAEFGGPEWAVQITDAKSGEVVLELGWDEMEEAANQANSRFATHDDGATTIYSHEGDVVMVITDEQAFEGFEHQSVAAETQTDHVLFIELEGQWHEVVLPDDHTPEALAIGANEILVGTVTFPTPGRQPGTNELGVLVGRLP